MAKTVFSAMNREIRKQMKGTALADCRISQVGSFLAFRIEDKAGRVTVRDADVAARIVGSMLADAGLSSSVLAISGCNFVYNGVVANWEIKR